MLFLQTFLPTRNKLARAAQKTFECIEFYSIENSIEFYKEILNKLARAAREIF